MKLALRIVAVVFASVALVATGVAGYDYIFGLGGGNDIAAESPSTLTVATRELTTSSMASSTTRPPRSTTTRPPTTTTIPPVQQPAPQAMPPGSIAQGSSGDLVRAYEERLAALRFDPGAIDGVFDQDMRYAVEAVQKRYDLPRTGAIGDAERFVISAFQYPDALVADGEPNRVEVSLDRQYMVVYHGGQVRLITTVSSGSGRHFCGGDDGCQYAITTPGRFTFQWRVNGWREGSLGSLYKPFYFNGGIAVHGYSSVPTYNASHGCVRIPMHVAEYFQDLVVTGEPIYVIGQAADPTSRFSGPGPGPQGTVSAPGVATPAPPAPVTTQPPATQPPPTVTTMPPATVPSTSPSTAPSTTTTRPPTTTTRPPTTTTAPTTTTTSATTTTGG